MSIIGFNNQLIKNLEIWQILAKLGTLSMQASDSEETDENRNKLESEFEDLKIKLKAAVGEKFEGRKAFPASDKATSGDDTSASSPMVFQVGYAPNPNIPVNFSNFNASSYYTLRSIALSAKQLFTSEDKRLFEAPKNLINTPASDKATSGDDTSASSPMEFQVGYAPNPNIPVSDFTLSDTWIDQMSIMSVEAAKTSKKLIDQSMDIMSHLDSEISFQTKVVEDINKGQELSLILLYQARDLNHKLCALKYYQANVEKVLNTIDKLSLNSLKGSLTDQDREKIDVVYQSQLDEISNISSKMTQDMLLAVGIDKGEYFSHEYLGIAGTKVKSINDAANAIDSIKNAKLKALAQVNLTRQNLIEKIGEDNCHYSLESEIEAEQVLLQIEQEALLGVDNCEGL